MDLIDYDILCTRCDQSMDIFVYHNFSIFPMIYVVLEYLQLITFAISFRGNFLTFVRYGD